MNFALFLSLLLIFLIGLILPYDSKQKNAKAITDLSGDSSVTITSTNNTATVTISPTTTGTFATTSGSGDIAFSVSTDNYTGYTLTARSSYTTLDNNNDSFQSLTSSVTAEQFSSASNTALNNHWGYKPNYYNSEENTKYYGASTTAVTLDTTSTANNTAKNYTISLGARANNAIPSGNYINNSIILEAVANVVPFSFLTINYGDGVTSVTIGSSTIADGETVKLIQGVPYDINMTYDSTFYAFDSWTATSGMIGSSSTQSTTYTINSSNATLTANVTFIGGPDIQNLNGAGCTSTASLARDNRDGHVYKIQRLADDNCWMMENLDLGRIDLTTDLTSANTNLSTTVIAATFNGWRKTSGTHTYTAGEFIPITSLNSYDGLDTDTVSGAPYGTLYNYYAASAGTIAGDTNYRNASYDICPSGWRLPSGGDSGELMGLYTYYNSASLMRASTENNGAAFVLAGLFSNNLSDQGNDGQYLSSTRYSNTEMFGLTLYKEETVHHFVSDRDNGYSIRCILKESSHTLTVSYDAGVSNVTVNNTAIQNGGTITLKEGVPYTIAMTPSPRYAFGSWSATSGIIGEATQSTTYAIGDSDAILTVTAAFSGPNIQNLSSSDCTTTASYAKDIRDWHVYAIQRLADGNCWMMENLELGSTDLTADLNSTNTNISSTVTASTFNSWKKTSGSQTFDAGEFINISGSDSTSGAPYGTLYNYYAASAGTITGSSNSNNARYDICPAGWRLPTGGNSGEFRALYNQYNSNALMRASIENSGAAFSLSGIFENGNPTDQGSSGNYWTSTVVTDSLIYRLYISTERAFPTYTIDRNFGLAIRCILKKPTHTLTVSYGAAATDVTINGISVADGETMELEEGQSYSVSISLISGYSFTNWSVTSGTLSSVNTLSTTYTSGSSDATITANTSFIGPNIQNLPASACTTNVSATKDIRDGHIYLIQRLKDGNCWMMENLDLGRTDLTVDLTSANTNLSTTVTASTFNSWEKTTGYNGTDSAGEFIPLTSSNSSDGLEIDTISRTPYGTLYNYYAASAGTISGSRNSNNAEYDICPSRWRLPTFGNSGEFSTLVNSYNSEELRAPVVNGGAAFSIAGFFTSASPVNQGSESVYWSSTLYDDTRMFGLRLAPGTSMPVTSLGNTRSRGVSIRCIHKGPDISELTYLQDFKDLSERDKKSVLDSMDDDTTYNLIDSRDNKTYAIAKLKDGNVWMTENLDLGRTNLELDLTSANTNISTTVTASTFNGWKKTRGTGTYTDGEFINISGTDATSGSPYGTLYNYYATSAGTISENTNSNNANYDICPAGWRLPTGGSSGEFQSLYTQYNSAALMRATIANGGAAFVRSGRFTNSTPASQGTYGYYWSSTTYNNTNMYSLQVYSSSIYPANNYRRDYGHAIRCVVK